VLAACGSNHESTLSPSAVAHALGQHGLRVTTVLVPSHGSLPPEDFGMDAAAYRKEHVVAAIFGPAPKTPPPYKGPPTLVAYVYDKASHVRPFPIGSTAVRDSRTNEVVARVFRVENVEIDAPLMQARQVAQAVADLRQGR
jgi:hypothetical protein